MGRGVWAICVAGAVIALAGCSQEDVKNVQNDTSKLGNDMKPMVTGAGLSAKVWTQLSMHKGIDTSGLHIEASDKTVTVSGHVRDSGMRKKVVDAINETTGVEQVVDKLNVQR
jgi:osmotically-inducible protein OsmY